MHSKTFFAVLALATAVVAAPLPTGSSPRGESGLQQIGDILGSPFGDGNNDGNGNSAGNGNDGNASGNGSGDGNENGNGNTFGNGNDILSGNSAAKMSRSDESSESLSQFIDGVVGSPFGDGNGDGNGSAAGNGNDGNAAGNGVGDGNGNGNGNIFGNGNDILSGNSGKKVRKSETLGTYVGNIIDDVTVPLEPGSSDSVLGSPSQDGDNDGDNNSAGSNNDNNGSENGSNNGNDNGSSKILAPSDATNNDFGNNNNILSGDPISIPVRRADLPPDSLDPIPQQTVDELNQDVGQIGTELPEGITQVLQGAGSFQDNQGSADTKRQVFTGIEDIVSQVGKVIPK
ncbi:hypothetical protein LSUE1_G006049 [Lachnellula suecica]|uniref:Uncharacterized protein n=1 Tax=Lachnellula suecica TaxID=602035 RepID=A0A8T9BXS4_9HELO|nr:hypothetical protein LSUE1_G006049 [Lachnellula suecica]